MVGPTGHQEDWLKQLNGAIYAPSKLYFKTEEDEDEKFLDFTEQSES